MPGASRRHRAGVRAFAGRRIGPRRWLARWLFAVLVVALAAAAVDPGSATSSRSAISSFADAAIIFPQQYQVFQRDTDTSGEFVLWIRPQIAGLESARVTVSDRSGTVLLDQSLPVALSADGTYQTRLRLPAGGWYVVAVEQRNASGERHDARVDAFGIGDVFVAAGQSNASSSGESLTRAGGAVSAYVPDLDADGRLAGPGHWQLNEDPQPPECLPTEEVAQAEGYSRENFGSVWPTMGEALHQQRGIPIATATTAIGGTTIAQWQRPRGPGAEAVAGVEASRPPPYIRFMETTKFLVQSTGVRMILWDQGESDNLSEAQTFPLSIYGDQFRQLQADLAEDVGTKIPWMIAIASFIPANEHLGGSPCDSLTLNEYWTRLGAPLVVHSIRLALEQLVDDGVAFRGPDTDRHVGATGRYPGPRGGCIHFSAEAQIAVGSEWAERIAAIRVGDVPVTGSLRAPGVHCRGKLCLCGLGRAEGDAPTSVCPDVALEWQVSDPHTSAHVTVEGTSEPLMAGIGSGSGAAHGIGTKPVTFSLVSNDRILDHVVVRSGSVIHKPSM